MNSDASPRLANLATWQLSHASARSRKVLHERLTQAGASGYDYRILAVLGDLGPASQADLGRAAALDRRDVTHTVRDLHARTLVTRRPDPRDGRQTLVELTAAGSSMLERLDLVLDEVQTEVFAGLTVDQRRTLANLLQQLS
ncbi:MAG: MarR family winged helix-turn-helix transcriptional regulator [Acidimicrobiales bacterium]